MNQLKNVIFLFFLLMIPFAYAQDKTNVRYYLSCPKYADKQWLFAGTKIYMNVKVIKYTNGIRSQLPDLKGSSSAPAYPFWAKWKHYGIVIRTDPVKQIQMECEFRYGTKIASILVSFPAEKKLPYKILCKVINPRSAMCTKVE